MNNENNTVGSKKKKESTPALDFFRRQKKHGQPINPYAVPGLDLFQKN